MKAGKHAVARIASWLGYTVVPTWRLARLPQQRHVARLIELLGIDCIVDVGAHRGQYRDFLRDDVGYDGLIVSFEPLPALAAKLAERARSDRRWIVEPFALGRESGFATINVMASDTFSSFLAPSQARTRLFDRGNAVVDRQRVPVRTLDAAMASVRPRVSFARPYLKLDTQGFDLAVLEGGPDFLATTVALQTEASATPIYEGAPDFVQVIRFLEGAGFELSGMFPNNPEHFPRMIEFDCHMVRSSALPDAARAGRASDEADAPPLDLVDRALA